MAFVPRFRCEGLNWFRNGCLHRRWVGGQRNGATVAQVWSSSTHHDGGGADSAHLTGWDGSPSVRSRRSEETQVSIVDVHVVQEWALMKVRSTSSHSQTSSHNVPHRQVLHEHGSPVLRPINQPRHSADGVCQCLSCQKTFGPILLLFGFPADEQHSRQISKVSSPGKLYSSLMEVIVRFTRSVSFTGTSPNSTS